MTYGNEPRRKRSGSSSRDEAEEADNWLAGLRPSGGRDGEPDPFAGPPASSGFEPFDPPTRGFGRGGSDIDASARFDAPPFDQAAPFDEAPPRGGRRRTDDEPTGGLGRRRAREETGPAMPGSPGAPAERGFPSTFPSFTGHDAPSTSGYGGPGAFGGQAAGPVDSPPTGTFEPPTSAFGGTTNTFGGATSAFGGATSEPRGSRGAEPPYAGPPPTRTSRRRSRDDAPSYDHGPELTPIIKPLSAYPAQPPTEPPPLTPIFPSHGTKPAPPLSERTGALPGSLPGDRTGALPGSLPGSLPGDRTGSLPGSLPGDRTGALPGDRTGRRSYDAGHEDSAPRRPRPRPDEATGPARTSRSAAIHNPAAFARGPVGPAVDQPIDFDQPRFDAPRFEPPRFERPRSEPSGFEQPKFEPAGFEQAGPPRAARGPAADDTAYAPPARTPYEPRERDWEERENDDFSIGGTLRALQPPDTRPAGQPGGRPPGRSGPRGPRGGVPSIDPVKVGSQHRPHRWIAALSVIGVLVLVAACGLGTYFMIKDERKGPDGARTSSSQGPQERDISSRAVDPALLTEDEVFPTDSIPSAPNEAPYAVLKTQIQEDCTAAAADDLGKLLVDAGCNQVVRATMKSPNGDYLITAGLFNLRDQTAAQDAFNGVKPIIDATKGRFLGMSAGPNTGTDSIVRAPTQLGWNFRGHFIAYCVIARTDGQAFAANDNFPNQITFDVVETYLEGTVIGARAVVQGSPTPAASPAAS